MKFINQHNHFCLLLFILLISPLFVKASQSREPQAISSVVFTKLTKADDPTYKVAVAANNTNNSITVVLPYEKVNHFVYCTSSTTSCGECGTQKAHLKPTLTNAVDVQELPFQAMNHLLPCPNNNSVPVCDACTSLKHLACSAIASRAQVGMSIKFFAKK